MRLLLASPLLFLMIGHRRTHYSHWLGPHLDPKGPHSCYGCPRFQELWKICFYHPVCGIFLQQPGNIFLLRCFKWSRSERVSISLWWSCVIPVKMDLPFTFWSGQPTNGGAAAFWPCFWEKGSEWPCIHHPFKSLLAKATPVLVFWPKKYEENLPRF